MDNIDDVRNSIIISLATCGGIITDVSKNSVRLVVTFQNTDKTDPDKEIFNTFIIPRRVLWQLLAEAAELHTQIDEMVSEEEMKKREEENKKELEHQKKEADKKKRAKDARDAKKRKQVDKNKIDDTSDLMIDGYEPYDIPMLPPMPDLEEGD